MARFYASIQGSRGMATRQGTAKSGIAGHIRGWHSGARVWCYVNEDGEDAVHISITGGSTGHISEKTVAIFVDGKVKFLAKKKDLKQRG